MNTRERRTKQEYALLQAAEFFRDELRWGSVAAANARLTEKFEALKDLCFKALNDPSVADADEIKRRYHDLTGAGRGNSEDAPESSLRPVT